MSVQLHLVSQTFRLYGDGTATEARLSVHAFPFLNMPLLTPASVVLGADGGGNIASVSLEGTEVVFSFASAFSGDSGGVSASLYFDIPA